VADRHVTQTGKDDDGDITALCKPLAAWSPRYKADAIADIDKKLHRYFTRDKNGNEAEVQVYTRNGVKHLRTTPDSSGSNNLDDLPDCTC